MCAVALMSGPHRADTSIVKRFLPTAVAALVLVAGASTASAGAPVASKSVIGGAKLNVSQVPSIASVLTKRSLCTGSVIAPDRVLTAAHCVDSAPNMRVRTSSASSFSGGQEVEVTEVVVHPEVRRVRGGLLNDLAVLHLAEPVTAPPIVLSDAGVDAGMTLTGAPMLAAGYGQAQMDLRKKRKVGILRGVLQFARPHICRRVRLSLATTVCTNGERMGAVKTGSKGRATQRTPCHGDSGGPLIGYSPQGPRLVGVLSTGNSKRSRSFGWVECGIQGQGAAYIRVSAYLDFILTA
jgi:secreted trypsin-like serine protease